MATEYFYLISSPIISIAKPREDSGFRSSELGLSGRARRIRILTIFARIEQSPGSQLPSTLNCNPDKDGAKRWLSVRGGRANGNDLITLKVCA